MKLSEIINLVDNCSQIISGVDPNQEKCLRGYNSISRTHNELKFGVVVDELHP